MKMNTLVTALILSTASASAISGPRVDALCDKLVEEAVQWSAKMADLSERCGKDLDESDDIGSPSCAEYLAKQVANPIGNTTMTCAKDDPRRLDRLDAAIADAINAQQGLLVKIEAGYARSLMSGR